MKTLNDYTDEKISELYNKTGAFFAFSNKQFEEKKVEGVEYVSMDGGIICPKENVKTLVEGMNSVYETGIKQDLEENGKDKIIERELYNHEAFYTWDYETTFSSLVGYGITRDEVKTVFYKLAETQSNS